MKSKFMLPLDCFMDVKAYTDCRMYCFSKLASFYNCIYTLNDFIGHGVGIDFKLINITDETKPIYLPQGKDLDTEVLFLTKMGIDIKSEMFDHIFSPQDLFNQLSKMILSGTPVVFNIDRFYLKYMDIVPAHMGYHTVIAVGFDRENSEIYVIDCLSKNKFEAVAIETIHTAIYTDIPIATGRKYYYIAGARNTINNNNLNDSAFFLQSLEELFSKALGEKGYLSLFSTFMKRIMHLTSAKIADNDVRLKRYAEYQAKFFTESIIQQDFYKNFFRLTYFNFVQEQLNKHFPNLLLTEQYAALFNELCQLWDNIAQGSQNCDDALNKITKAYSTEEKIIFFLQSKLGCADNSLMN